MVRRSRLRIILAAAFLGALVFASPAPTYAQAPPLTQAPSSGFQATYYRGHNLQGTPLLTRMEPVVNWTYDIGGSPAPGSVPSTDFSTRWEGWYNIDRAGAWTLSYTSDDGGRVWLDNELIVDMWYDHGPFTRVKTKQLAAGYHLVRVEYYQGTGGMTSQLTITPPGMFPDWMGEYFDNPYLLGEPRYRVNNADINFNWGSGSPDARIGVDNFSVRWTRLYAFAAGNYTFSATADDGVRVWVGDTLAIDGWIPQQAKTYTKTLYLNGTYPLRVEYFEQGGDAVVNFVFHSDASPPPSASNEAWSGQLFNNAALTPPAACDLNLPTLAVNWGINSPGCNVAAQFYSAQWESTRRAPATGFYTVYLTVDDGGRIFVDDRLILDAWHAQPPTNYSTTVYLTADLHHWRVEYFQSTGGAQISLSIVAGVSPPAPPPAASADIIIDSGGAGWTQGGNGASWHPASVGYNNNALWTTNNAFIQPLYSWGRWYPSLPQARNYEVSVYIPAGIATTTNAQYLIFHNGVQDAVAIPQASYKNGWVPLGTYYFTAQGGEFVALSDVTYEPFGLTTIVWDAVKFTPR